MSYRDDDDALRLRHDDLVRELEVLEGKVADHQRVTDELARVRHCLSERQERRGPVRLANLKIASPCKERWEDMVGDARVRVCGGCERPVFNLSEMTMEDAEAVLATRGVTPCVRFYRRADGTVMTSDCPTVRRPRRVGIALAPSRSPRSSPACWCPTKTPPFSVSPRWARHRATEAQGFQGIAGVGDGSKNGPGAASVPG